MNVLNVLALPLLLENTQKRERDKTARRCDYGW